MLIVLTTVCSLVVLVTAMMLCLCWRRKTQKNDLLGLDGLVTQKNPDENVNHLPSVAQTVPDGVVKVTGDPTATASDANKRPVVVNNPRRSLPDIPSDGVHLDGDVVTYEPNGDNSSDLYATVEPYQNSSKRRPVPNGLDARPSISQHSSISQADDTFSPYAHVREHPYDKVKSEHPYARVQSSSSSQEQEENSSEEATPRTVALRSERTSGQSLGEPSAPSRSRRSSGQSAIADIPAATAVAGGIAANQELPYMTPPITQPNFSGDSQDSSKGYTTISVREPLPNIRAQTKVLQPKPRDLDPHYSTVSDDSDEVYTTIQDPNNAIYTSGSETYAQIQPPHLTVAAEINVNSSSTEDDSSEPERAPQPPSVDSLKNVTHSHSRQASSSSSVGNLGSPKPEKRQANSPLPPPPSITPELGEKPKNLDDMYAKVQKGHKKSKQEEAQRKSTSSSSSEEKPVELPTEHNYETLRKSPRKTSDPGYEKLSKDSDTEPGYDTINGPESILSSDPGYEVLKHSDPNYEELRRRSPGYSSINKTDGYSVVNKPKSSSSEECKSKSSYESRDFSTDEPNYESMPSESISEHNYAVLKSTGSDTDPNYESVHHNDPNYESVKYLDVSLDEPPYERLQDEDSSRSENILNEGDPGYEKITGEADGEVNPGYETIKKDKKVESNGNIQLEADFDGIVQV